MVTFLKAVGSTSSETLRSVIAWLYAFLNQPANYIFLYIFLFKTPFIKSLLIFLIIFYMSKWKPLQILHYLITSFSFGGVSHSRVRIRG